MDSLLNTAPCGFLSFNDSGEILSVNQTLLNLLGYECQELEGQHIETILSRGARIFYQTHFFPLLRLQGKIEEVYFSLLPKPGQSLPVLCNAARYERETVVYDCIFVPMMQRNRYEDEILQAKKAAEEASGAKAKFLSMISHELRTPLTAIMGYTEVLKMGLHGPVTEEQLNDLGRIAHASQYLLSLLNDILSFAQAEAGRVEIKLKTVELEDVFSRAEALVTPQLQERNLQFVRAECGTLAAFADPDRLQQILLNLLTNAIKFTPPGGRIGLVCTPGDECVLIHISDTGCGMPPEKLPYIFDPFVQLENDNTAANQRGVGLGLAISRDFARAMNGELSVQSTPGQGSTFTITLPRADKD